MRTLRALRPLRAMSRMQGMRVGVEILLTKLNLLTDGSVQICHIFLDDVMSESDARQDSINNIVDED